jgi:hypothetical protein
MHFEGSGTTIDLVPNSGSSADLNPSGPTHLQDIKGYPFGSPYTNGTTVVEVGLGAIISGEIVAIIPTSEINDNGRIRKTTIVREGENLKISWGYDSLGPIAVKIYVSSGASAEFQSSATAYAVLTTASSATTTYLFLNTAHNGNNYYFRVVPDPLVNPDIMSSANNSITVGKTETSLPANKYVFCGLPFMDDSVSLENILGEQIGTAGDMLWWNGSVYQGANYVSGWVGDDRMLRLGEGFIVRAKTSSKLCLTGRFGKLITPYVRTLANNQFALIDYPWPTQKQIELMGIAPSENANLLRWKLAEQVYDGANYSGGAWVGDAGVGTLLLGQPRFYRPKAEYSWNIQAP